MKWRLVTVVATISLACVFATAAHAKERQKTPGVGGLDFDTPEQRASKILAVTPPEKMPDLPSFDEPEEEVYESSFPALPPSRPCEAKDIRGMFKLAAVYEDPPGAETTGFSTNPNQYILFHPNTIFMRLNVGEEDVNPKEALKMMVEHNQNNLQYVLQENGFVYFYQDSVAIDVKVCFVVDKSTSSFRADQMLLMPPKGQIAGRLVHVYDVIRRAGKKSRGGKKRGKPAWVEHLNSMSESDLSGDNSSSGPHSAAEQELRRLLILKLKMAMERKKKKRN